MDVHIIDDERSTRTLYVGMMSALGYQAQAFSSSDDYLEYMGSPDYLPPKLAILSNLDMSEYEFMNAVGELNPHKRFVIITDSSEEPTHDEFAYFYLAKSFSSAVLEKVLQGASLCKEDKAHPDILVCFLSRRAPCVNEWKIPA